MRTAEPHDWGFFLWMLPGFLFSFGLIAMASIGLPFLLAGVISFAVLHMRGPEWPADLGLAAGIGATCLLIAAISAVDGDVSPDLWALAGLLLTGGSAGAFWWLRCRPRPRAGGGTTGA